MKNRRTVILSSITVIVGLLIVLIFPYYFFITQTLHISPLKIAFDKVTVKNDQGAVNVLLLGMGDGSHDGPQLADSISILHYDIQKNHLTTIGIPRDIWSEELEEKINASYAIGEALKKGDGNATARKTISALSSLPIHYLAIVNFHSFQEIVDAIGGIDVTVEQPFTDYYYPVEGKEQDLCDGDPYVRCRYEVLTFVQGSQHMNGTRALKFVRSRHSSGAEGSDFARNHRQQLVLAAVKNKLIPLVTQDIKNGSLTQLKKLYAILDRGVQRDITNEEAAMLLKSVITKKGFSQTNTQLPADLFVDEKLPTGQQVLIPFGNSPELIHTFVSCVVKERDGEMCREVVLKSL